MCVCHTLVQQNVDVCDMNVGQRQRVAQHMLVNICLLCGCGYMTVIMECNCTEEEGKEEPRMLGLALIPGRHIISICIDSSMPP